MLSINSPTRINFLLEKIHEYVVIRCPNVHSNEGEFEYYTAQNLFRMAPFTTRTADN